MKQWFRLARSTDIKRVRRNGKSYAHPLVVLVVERNLQPESLQVGVIAGKFTGGAVTRNLIKRRIKAILDQDSQSIQKGWDLIFIARSSAGQADFLEIREAMFVLLRRARLLEKASKDVGK
ncbi:MAG: ribonuclease P protein component [Anaerolineaceae bacterium]